jgi:hypothetical protein
MALKRKYKKFGVQDFRRRNVHLVSSRSNGGFILHAPCMIWIKTWSDVTLYVIAMVGVRPESNF